MEEKAITAESQGGAKGPAAPRIKKNPRVAFAAGEKAKRNGWERISPFSSDPTADVFFYEGFDGTSWEDATVKWNFCITQMDAAIKKLIA